MRNHSEPPSLAAIKSPISQEALDQLFSRSADTLHVASRTRASRAPAQGLRIGPSWATSANASPARSFF